MGRGICGGVGRGGNVARLEPAGGGGGEGEEAVVGPVAGGEEEDGQEDGAVDAGPVEGIG